MQLARLSGVKPSDTTLSYNYCVVQSVSPSCCMYLLDDVSTLHFTVWDFNLFTPNEQIGGIVSLEVLHVGGFSGHISGTSIDLSVEVTRAPYGREISHAYDDDMQRRRRAISLRDRGSGARKKVAAVTTSAPPVVLKILSLLTPATAPS